MNLFYNTIITLALSGSKHRAIGLVSVCLSVCTILCVLRLTHRRAALVMAGRIHRYKFSSVNFNCLQSFDRSPHCLLLVYVLVDQSRFKFKFNFWSFIADSHWDIAIYMYLFFQDCGRPPSWELRGTFWVDAQWVLGSLEQCKIWLELLQYFW